KALGARPRAAGSYDCTRADRIAESARCADVAGVASSVGPIRMPARARPDAHRASQPELAGGRSYVTSSGLISRHAGLYRKSAITACVCARPSTFFVEEPSRTYTISLRGGRLLDDNPPVEH